MRKQNQVTNKFISSVFSTVDYPDVISAGNKRNSPKKSRSCLSRKGFSLVQSDAFDSDCFPAPAGISELLKQVRYGATGSCALHNYAKKPAGDEKYVLFSDAIGYSDIWKLALLLIAVACIHILVPRSRTLSAFVVGITHETQKPVQ